MLLLQLVGRSSSWKKHLQLSVRVVNRSFSYGGKTIQEPEPSYDRESKNAEEIIVHFNEPFNCQYGEILPELNLAYEVWGEMNSIKDNVVLIQHGLTASSHAKSSLELDTSAKGWWENFIGPGLALDTNKFCIICVNLLGSCFGSTGPSSINPTTRKPYGGDFPIVSIGDMIGSQFQLLDHLGVNKLHAVVGSSLGGLASFYAAAYYSNRIDRMISISAGGNSLPSAIAYRYLQRVALMNDPRWNGGHYYDSEFPVQGTIMARKIATLTYRSDPEWNERFHTKKVENIDAPRYKGTEFLVEDYIRHQGENFIQKTKYDPNSLIFLSKAMDIFDIGEGLPEGMEEGFSKITCPTLILGASTDILYPPSKQEEAANHLVNTGNKEVTLRITEGNFGHDTFFLDVAGMGSHMKTFLEI